MPHLSAEQKLKSICSQESFIECNYVLSSESRGKVQVHLPPTEPHVFPLMVLSLVA